MTKRPAQRMMALTAVATLLGMAPWFSATAVLGTLRIEWELSSSMAAWLTISVQLGFVAGALVSAALALPDRLKIPPLMAGSAILGAAANALVASADGPGAALPFRFLSGFAMAGVYPPAMKLMATWFREGRGRAIGIVIGALTIGSAAPHLLRAVLVVDWRVVILTISGLSLIGAGISGFLLREGPFPFPPGRFDPRQIGTVIRNRGVRLASFGYFGHMWELFAMWAWFGAFFTDALSRASQGSPTLGSLATFAVVAVGAFGAWWGGEISDRHGREEATILALGLSGTCAALSGFLSGGPPVVLFVIGLVWGVWVIADSGQFSTIVTEVADQTMVGTALTLQTAFGFTLTVVTIWLVPILRDASGWTLAMLLLVPGPILGIAAMERLRRLRGRGELQLS